MTPMTLLAAASGGIDPDGLQTWLQGNVIPLVITVVVISIIAAALGGNLRKVMLTALIVVVGLGFLGLSSGENAEQFS